MKAAMFRKYGSPEVLHLEDVPKPNLKDDEILIKVIATTVNSGDCRLRKPDPALVRLFFGFFKPKINILGMTFAGVIEDVGLKVKDFKVGQEIYGMDSKTLGANAEYMVIDPSQAICCIKPQSISFQEAASIPFGFTTASHFLNLALIRAGQSILIYGASGAVGVSVLQIAKSKGAIVTTVTSSKNLDLMKSLGADYTIDYQTEDFKKNNIKYDIVMDCVNKMELNNINQSLVDNGTLILSAAIFKEIFTTYKLRKNYKVILGTADERIEYLKYANWLIEEQNFKIVIDKEYNLEQIVEAHRYVESGHKVGSIVVNICSTKPSETYC